MVRLDGWDVENCIEGFSWSDSCKPSEDSTMSMRTESWVRETGECLLVLRDCAETASAATKHRRDARRKIILANSGSGLTRFLISRSLRVLWGGRVLGQIGILLDLV